MIIHAAVCPHPPMLVPEVAAGAAGQLTALLAACDAAVAALVADSPDRVTVIGSGPTAQTWDAGAGGTLAPYGIELCAGGDIIELPLSLTIGAWLLDRARWTGSRTYVAVADSAGTGPYESQPPDHDRTTPKDAGEREESIAVLAMADGSAKRSAEAPGYLDERATDFDASIAAALATGDTAYLSTLDQWLATELWAAGTPALAMLADMIKGAQIEARLLYDEAPFGVGYWVADWKTI